MANYLQSVLDKVKSVASSLGKKVNFNPESNTGDNFWSTPVAQGLVKTQQYFQSPQALTPFPTIKTNQNDKLPMQIGKAVANIPSDIGNTIVGKGILAPSYDLGTNIGKTITNQPLTPYSQLQSPITRLGYQTAGVYQPTSNTDRLKQTAGNLAGIAEPILTSYLPKGIIKLGAKPTLQKAVKAGVVSGAKYGGAFGGISSLSENRDTKNNGEYALRVLGSIAGGAGMGAALGGATGAIAGAIDKIILSKNPKMTIKEVQTARNTYLMDESGKFRGSVAQKKEPIYYGDIRESFGLPRTGLTAKDLPVGLSVKELTKAEHNANVSQAGLYDIKNTTGGFDVIAKNGDRIGQYVDGSKKFRLYDSSGQEHILASVDKGQLLKNMDSILQKHGLVSQAPLSEVTKGIESTLSEGKTPILTTKAKDFESVGAIQKQQQKLLQKFPGVDTSKQEPVQALDDIIAQGRKQIGGKIEEPKVSIKKTFDDFYTQWVDRYNPVTRVSSKVKAELKTKGAVLRPEVDPEYLVRRLSGAGGIADYRFRTELNPVLKEIETSGIPKIDMDTYLANKRMAAFGTIERDIYGNDPVKAGKVVEALDQKYGPQLAELTDKLYAYQDKGFQEMVDAGFISPEVALKIKSQNPDYSPLYRVMDDVSDYLGLPTKKLQQGTQPIQKIKGSKKLIESPVESIIGNTFSQRAAIEKNAVAKSIVGLQDVIDVGFKKVSKSAPDTITIWKNGQKEFWQVGQDIADTAKGANEEAMNLVLKIIQAPAALLRQGATGRNPEFMLPNIIRDQLDAGVTSRYGYIPFVDYISGLKSMLTNDSVYQKWQSSGAKIALGEMSGKKSIKQMFETAKSRQGLFKKLGSVLDFMGKYSEEPTRVGLFKKAYKKTGNELLSVMESRDSTVDFARMGSKMAVANRIIPFLNVGVQGFDKLIRSVKNNPGKVLLNATLYGVAPSAALTIYNLQNYPEEYKEIPQYEKDSNFVLIKGRNEDGTVDYVTFPKGNVIPTIANPIQSFIEYAYGNDQQSFGEMALQTLSSTLPVVGDGQSMQEIALKTIGSNLPQAVKPLAENLLNKSFYKYDVKKEQTKEIVPSYLQRQEPYKQAYEWTPKLYKSIGAALNVSPLKVQNLMEGYLAGYVKVPSQIIEMFTGDTTPNEKTILRRFIKQTYPSSGAPPAEKPPTTPLMERITGKVSAAGTDKKVTAKYWYTDESGYSKALDIGKVASMPSTSGYEKILKDKESFSLVGSILDKLPQEKQAEALQQLGISVEDATYYNVARQTNDVKSAWINDEISNITSTSKDRGKMLDYLISQRKEVNGDMILANGVVDQLYEDGIISKSEKTMLKNLTIKEGKVNTKLTGRGTKTAIKKVSTPTSSKISAPKIKTMAQLLAKSGKIRTKNYNFKKNF
jgi:hypothetical protein